MVYLNISKIEPSPYQVRSEFTEKELKELADSIKTVGLINRIMVRPHPEKEGYYQIIHGERRLRACKLLGWSEIEAEVKELSDKQAAEIGLIENLQREDINPLDEAVGYQALIDKFGYTKNELAEKIGKSRPYISNSIRLLDLPPFLKICVLCKTLSPWHARTIMSLPDNLRKTGIANLVMDWNLSVAETRQAVNDLKDGSKWILWLRDVPINGLWHSEELDNLIPPLSTYENKILEASLAKDGQLQPITVDPTGRVIDGNNRVRSARKLGWKTINAQIIFFRNWLEIEPDSNPDLAITLAHFEVPEGLPDIRPELTEEQTQNLIRQETLIQQLTQKGKTPRPEKTIPESFIKNEAKDQTPPNLNEKISKLVKILRQKQEIAARLQENTLHAEAEIGNLLKEQEILNSPYAQNLINEDFTEQDLLRCIRLGRIQKDTFESLIKTPQGIKQLIEMTGIPDPSVDWLLEAV